MVLTGLFSSRNAAPIVVDLLAQSIAANTASADGNTLTANANGVMAAVDGVTPVVDMLILYLPGSARDGVYRVSSVGSVSAPFTLERHDGFRSGAVITGGFIVGVGLGTANAGSLHLLSNAAGFATAATLNTSTLAARAYIQQTASSTYTDTSGTPGNATANTGSGRSAVALGDTAVTITCSQCFADSVVNATAEDIDATLTHFKVAPGNGSFVLTGNAAATAAFKFRWSITNAPA